MGVMGREGDGAVSELLYFRKNSFLFPFYLLRSTSVLVLVFGVEFEIEDVITQVHLDFIRCERHGFLSDARRQA